MINSHIARWSYDSAMRKKLLVSLVALMALVSPVSAAELKYTMHMEAKPAANAANDPMSAMAGGMISQMFPAGGLDQMVIAGDKGVRSEQKQEFGGMKAGTVTLIKPDGTQYVLDASTKTYWKQATVPAEVTAMMAQMNPKVTIGKTGVFETINGMKCERITMNMAMAIPGVDPSQLPPGMPTELTMVYEVWLTDAVKMPPAAGAMSMFGVEMIMESRDIMTEAAAPELFEIPKDYKEVPAPGGGGLTSLIR